MAVEQLPARVREFANYLNSLLARLDQGAGWCAVFWQRDPEGMRACLDGLEVPPWDVVEALLQDLAAEYGPEVAAPEKERARPLHAAALNAYDARPGGRDAVGDRLDVMLREQRYAAERVAELGRLLPTAATQEDADAIRLDLAWARDDHDRATARCAELRARMADLDRRSVGGGHVRGAQLIRPRSAGERRGHGPVLRTEAGSYGPQGAHPSGDDTGVATPGQGTPSAPGNLAAPAPGTNDSTTPTAPTQPTAFAQEPRHRMAYDPAQAYEGPHAAAFDPALDREGSQSAVFDSGPVREPRQPTAYDSAQAHEGPQAAAFDSALAREGSRPTVFDSGLVREPRQPTAHDPAQAYEGSQPAAFDPGRVPEPRHPTAYDLAQAHEGSQAAAYDPVLARETPHPTAYDSAPAPTRPTPHPAAFDPTPTPTSEPPQPPASAPAPDSPRPTPKQRKRRRGGARFAGMVEEEAAPTVVPPGAVPVLPAPAPTTGRTLRGARFAGVAEEPDGRAEPEGEVVDSAARRDVAGMVETLVRLRSEGRTGEAHVLLVEAAYWPAARFPLLAAEMERAGLGADWATLLWEAASLPAEQLVAAADALVAAGRDIDGEQILRQGVGRPAGEIGRAVLALAREGRRREVRALLDAYVRVRTPEEAARSAGPDPQTLVPLLLEAAQGVSAERHWDLVHALRVAGLTT
ncbi:hypothetical protein SSP24_10790 [Streptomyces spinoverrucosus]|uniref:UL36 very large tegument protein n=1 Tax=Streptomyces spinoverrucosus TaxID=284043 RepID=A0A4Y3V990_9ACTN|nr:hypothetical protein [Streptomyces spinoverrucosus]GEC03424.1 hypothetical protein SSP24_10790 [Streptomyces spinoverrucosus]GHB35767.1 hypothetical protein GCM10010397_01780 [Streptomyces spinoverrucosus]